MIEFREPPRTGFELTWRFFGIRFRILPSFFLVSVILSYLFVGPNPIGIVIDVACIFIAIVFTEFVQGIVYRSYGLRSTVLIQEFGGGIYPEAMPPTALQRIVVALANPASSFLLLAIVYYSNQEYGWRDHSKYFGFAYFILWLISLFWGIIGLLPIFPYPGGRVLLELLTLASPRNGLVATLVVSIVVALAYIAYTIAVYFRPMVEVPLVEGYRLPASIILSVFFALAIFHNWQFLQIALAQRRQASTYDDYHDDRAPWEA